jgi:hypothetical protein
MSLQQQKQGRLALVVSKEELQSFDRLTSLPLYRCRSELRSPKGRHHAFR